MLSISTLQEAWFNLIHRRSGPQPLCRSLPASWRLFLIITSDCESLAKLVIDRN